MMPTLELELLKLIVSWKGLKSFSDFMGISVFPDVKRLCEKSELTLNPRLPLRILSGGQASLKKRGTYRIPA